MLQEIIKIANDGFGLILGVSSLVFGALLWRLRGIFTARADFEVMQARMDLMAKQLATSEDSTKAVQALDNRFDELSEKVVSLEADLKVIQAEMEHLPSKDDVAKITTTLAELKSGHTHLAQSQARMEGAVTRIEDYLLKAR
ncbi:MAG: hypothetical protein J0H82_30255 [Alphaproteobacteria bacterium]|nr:hypothetical protein [Alphaproteobacteria bacterium]